MKILWFNWKDIKNPQSGGAEVFTHEVCKRLAKMGNEVTLFTSNFIGGENEEEVEGIEVIREGNRYSVYSKARLYYMKNKNRFDLLVDGVNTRPFLTPKYANGTLVVAVIYQLAREFWLYETPFPFSVIGYYLLENRWLKNYVDVPVITISKSTSEDLVRLGFKKVSIIPVGLGVRPLKSLPEKEERPTLLFIGRFKKAKKPDHAIKAFEIIRKELPNAQLWMVGDGYMMPKLRNIASDGVTFFERVTNDEKSEKLELMKRAHVLLMPGVREGWGLVVTEANAMGTPAIAYDIPGLRDSVLDKVTGVLVPPEDYVSMARAAVDLLKDEDKRNFYSTNAIRWAERFSWDRSASEFISLIEHLRFQ